MKSQLVILVMISSLLATNADQQCESLCDHLHQQCNQFKTKCSADTITIRSCCDLVNLPPSKAPSGVYKIESNCSGGSPFTLVFGAYCDMDCNGGGGWMVILKNIKDGDHHTFNKQWIDYELGFGDLRSSKFWYGLKTLACFTETGQWEMMIDFQFENKTWSHLHYNTFSVGPESEEYPLTIGEFTGITPTDPFVTHPLNGQRFSTVDNDNDGNGGSCAPSHGAWWQNSCSHINPTRQPPWINLDSTPYFLLSMTMKIRRRDCIIQ